MLAMLYQQNNIAAKANIHIKNSASPSVDLEHL